MAYLIAKYCGVFLLASVLGIFIGRWSVRRLFVDVTDSYQTLSRSSLAAEDAPWDEIRARFDDINGNVRTIVRNEFRANPYPEIPRAFFEKIENSIANISNAIKEIPEPEKVDLSGFSSELSKINATLVGLSDHSGVNDLSETVRRLSDEVAAIPAPQTPIPVNLAPLEEKVVSLKQAVENIPRPEAPRPVDLSSIESQLREMKQTILALPAEMTAKPVDLTPLERQLSLLKSDIAKLPTPATPSDLNLSAVTKKIEALESLVNRSAENTRNALDLSPMYNRLEQLEILVKDGTESSASIARQLHPLGQKLVLVEHNLAKLERNTDALDTSAIKSRVEDLKMDMNHLLDDKSGVSISVNELNERLLQLNGDIQDIKAVQASSQIDVTPIEAQLENISQNIVESREQQYLSLSNIDPVAERLDRMETLLTSNQHRQLDQIDPIDKKLATIQTQLAALNNLAPQTMTTSTRSASIAPQRLNRAEFGRKDKLQDISGIGPKLEQTLNQLGIYYYWQIAAWDKRDISAIDANLDTFRGRIERDDWVRQARRLRKSMHAAPRPTGEKLTNRLN